MVCHAPPSQSGHGSFEHTRELYDTIHLPPLWDAILMRTFADEAWQEPIKALLHF
jgi:hypothetical protein